MFKNLVLYRIHGWPESAAHIDEALQSHRFAPCAPTADKSMGWVEPRGQAHGPLIESVGGQHILRLLTCLRGKPCPSGRGRIARAAQEP